MLCIQLVTLDLTVAVPTGTKVSQVVMLEQSALSTLKSELLPWSKYQMNSVLISGILCPLAYDLAISFIILFFVIMALSSYANLITATHSMQLMAFLVPESTVRESRVNLYLS